MIELKLSFGIEVITKIIRRNKLPCRWKSFNSAEWLKRRDNDIYFERARKENYRCRSAFKLIEIDDKYKLIQPGHNVIDIGAAPGSWSQVLAKRTNANGADGKRPKGSVIAIDLSHIFPIEGVHILSNMDFTSNTAQDKVMEVLGKKKLDFVFSDMAPKASGVRDLDKTNIVNLVYPVIVFSVNNLRRGGGCLLKLWEGQHHKLVEDIKKFFKSITCVKPQATHSESSEIYVIGQQFYGLKK
ncbi:hypothetical protein RUM44_000590 [Polyplax serrata]|uniref:rRNA methyltransferase 2, mitochondrial n=1 Tax=Polyplax serrata TaxID=468196 RepID=A0ABR1B5Z5_POLSC